MTASLKDKRVMVLAASGVEESSMSTIQRELVKTAAVVRVVSTEAGVLSSWTGSSFGLYFPVDEPITQALGVDFDFLVVPSGMRSIKKLSATPHSERILSSFIAGQKPMCLIGDAVELLANTGLAKGWKVTGPETSMAIMTRGEANWIGGGEYIDNILMTGDIYVAGFVDTMITHFARGTVPAKKAA